jgi:hypothetical protein
MVDLLKEAFSGQLSAISKSEKRKAKCEKRLNAERAEDAEIQVGKERKQEKQKRPWVDAQGRSLVAILS